MQKKYAITCPHCNAEYLLSEIFIPKFVFGNVSNIIKDKDGKILSFDGEEVDAEEVYQCDFCNNKFKVALTLKTKVDASDGFSEQYETQITKKMTLFEDL